MGLTQLGCPSCGGALAVAEGQRLVTCQYCGGQNLVLLPDAIPRAVVAAQTDLVAAREAAQGVLGRPGMPAALHLQGRIQEVVLCYVPFYEFSGTRVGSFRLREEEKRPLPEGEDGAEGGELQQWLLEAPTVKEETRVIEQSYARVSPACDLPGLGVESIPLQKLRQSAAPLAFAPFDLVALQARGIVFAPTREPERFAEDAQWRVRAAGDRTSFVERRLRILYYPVWQARYQYRGRPYEIAVDGVSGDILRARVPADSRRQAAVAVAALGAAAFGFGRVARQLLLRGVTLGNGAGWISGTMGGALLFIVGGAVALWLAGLAWNAFREPGDGWLE